MGIIMNENRDKKNPEFTPAELEQAREKAGLFKAAEADVLGTTKPDDEYFQLALDNLRREKQAEKDYKEYVEFSS